MVEHIWWLLQTQVKASSVQRRQRPLLPLRPVDFLLSPQANNVTSSKKTALRSTDVVEICEEGIEDKIRFNFFLFPNDSFYFRLVVVASLDVHGPRWVPSHLPRLPSLRRQQQQQQGQMFEFVKTVIGRANWYSSLFLWNLSAFFIEMRSIRRWDVYINEQNSCCVSGESLLRWWRFAKERHLVSGVFWKQQRLCSPFCLWFQQQKCQKIFLSLFYPS